MTVLLYAAVLLLLWYSSLFDNYVFEVSKAFLSLSCLAIALDCTGALLLALLRHFSRVHERLRNGMASQSLQRRELASPEQTNLEVRHCLIHQLLRESIVSQFLSAA